MGYFKLKSKIQLDSLTTEDKIEESDFCTITPNGSFIQLEYKETDEKNDEYEVKPGIWVIQASSSRGFYLEKTSFVKDKILKEFLSTENVVSKVDKFFTKLDVYYKHGFEVPKRGGLLYGPAGTGKSASITEIAEKYSADGETSIVIWPTTKFKAYQVKDFIKTFKYINGVKKLIFVAEDIGGTEYDQGKMQSDSSLLSLLDNQEKTFKIPVYVLATTNFPEVLLGNLTNRPNRFDDKIEVGHPKPAQREALYKFFHTETIDENVVKYLKSSECDEFTPAHIREVIIRSEIHERSHLEVIKDIVGEIKKYKTEFKAKRQTMSILSHDDDD